MIVLKKEIRRICKAKRAAMSKTEVSVKSHAAARAFLASQIYKNCRQLMLYMSLGNEADPSGITAAAFADGKTVIFPVTDPETGLITPRYANKDTDFAPGAFSVSEPCGTGEAPLGEIDVIVVPGIAFAKTGARIGFGKGCYDRLLENSSAVKVGFCYDFQLYDKIPADEHDIGMDYIVTERGLIVI